MSVTEPPSAPEPAKIGFATWSVAPVSWSLVVAGRTLLWISDVTGDAGIRLMDAALERMEGGGE